MQQRSAAFALVENVFAQRAAGGVQPRLRVTYRDVGNRKTDANVREVIVTTTGYRDTLQMARLSEGVYEQAAEKPYPLAGLYTITLVGISAVNTEVNYTDGGSTGSPTAGLAARFEIRPETAATVQFTNVYPVITAGGLQNRVRATFRDAYTNLTDSLSAAQQEIWYSTSTDATAEAPITGTMLTSRISAGVYQADTLRHTVAGLYSFAVVGVSVTTGTQSFTVQPAADFAAEFAGLTTATIAGEAIPGFTVTYRDKQGNLTDNSLGRITYVRAGGSSTATVQALRLSEGVYAVQSTTVTLAGTYTFSVAGIVAANQTGNRVMTLSAAAPSVATFVATTTAMSSNGSKVTLTSTYRDRFGNLTDYTGSWKFTNTEFVSTGTITMTRKPNTSVGVFTSSFTVYAPGDYTLDLTEAPAAGVPEVVHASLPPMPSEPPVDFIAEPGPAYRGVFTGVVAVINPGQSQPAFTVTLYDRRNAPTDWWTGEMNIVYNGAGAGVIPYTQETGAVPWSSNLLRAIVTPLQTTGAYTLTLSSPDVQSYSGSTRRTFTVAQPVLNRTPNMLSFGNLVVGQVSAVQQYVLSYNNVYGDIGITAPAGYEISLTQASGFGQNLSIPYSAASGSVTVYVQFTPTAAQAYNGTITHTVGTANTTLTLTGTGVPPPPVITAQTAALGFGGIPLQTTREVAVPVRCANIIDPITITVPAEFAVAFDGTTFQTGTVNIRPNANGTVMLTVRFAPTSVGNKSAMLTLVSGTENSTLTLTGRGVARTTANGAVTLIDGSYYLNNQVIFPLGWGDAAGVEPSGAPGGLLQTPVSDGVAFTTNIATRVPGINFVEFEKFNGMMDVGAGSLFPNESVINGWRAAAAPANAQYFCNGTVFLNKKRVKIRHLYWS